MRVGPPLRRPGECSAPAGGLVQRGCTPHFLFHLVEKKTGRARSKRKDRFWSQLCTYVQSCCTGIGVRWCLRVCEGWPTGAAGYGTGLIVGSRGAVHLKSGCKDAFDQLLFPRVPLARKGHAASVSGKAANGCAVATRCPALAEAVALPRAKAFINNRPAAAKRGAKGIPDFPGPKGSPRAGRFRP